VSELRSSADKPTPDSFVSLEQYAGLLARLAKTATVIDPQPDAVVGITRSGLFPAVYLSHHLQLPMFTSAEAHTFPCPRLKYPLIVDTAAWTGKTARHIAARLTRRGVDTPAVLVMFARRDPLPDISKLHYLEQTSRIMHFWYEREECNES